MSKLKKKSIRQVEFLRGFTLIEMLVVFAIIGTLTLTGVTSFFAYSRGQDFQTSVANVSHALNDIRTRAILQAKPSQCGIKPLRYYQMNITSPGSTYKINVMCDTTLTTLQTNTLPNGVTFTNVAPVTINFLSSSGITPQKTTITIKGSNGQTRTITVDITGVISVQ